MFIKIITPEIFFKIKNGSKPAFFHPTKTLLDIKILNSIQINIKT